jgi:hypothetical protein
METDAPSAWQIIVWLKMIQNDHHEFVLDTLA